MARRPIIDLILARFAQLHAGRTSTRFFSALAGATTTQDRILNACLRRSRESDFGRDHGLDRINNYEDFARRVPIQNYERLSPYVERVRQGRLAALGPPSEPVLMFAMTSGTTATPKYIPITAPVLAEWRSGWNIWGLKALDDHPRALVRHILQVTSSMRDHEAPSGVPCGAITGLLAATQKRLVRRYYTSPPQVADIPDPTAKYYTIVRLAAPRDVAWAVTANPATLLLLARTLDEHKDRIIRDVRDGTLRSDLSVPGAVRDALHSRLAPDPAAARRLEEIATRTGHLFPRDIWRLEFLAHWTGGTMGLYRSQFPHYYGELPVRDIGLIASEGRMSIPVDDDTASGILAVTSHFFEFIPADEYGKELPAVLRSHQISEGEEYFLLLTNASGLFRYDIGDRVRVTGRAGQAPLIEFLSRDAHTSSLTGEKLTEHQVVTAMSEVAAHAGALSTDFVLAPQWAETPYYRIYLDEGAAGNTSLLAHRLDQALARVNNEYAEKRKSMRLGPLVAVELPQGMLARRDQELRRRRAPTSEQFKHQYLLPSPGLDADLEAAARKFNTVA